MNKFIIVPKMYIFTDQQFEDLRDKHLYTEANEIIVNFPEMNLEFIGSIQTGNIDELEAANPEKSYNKGLRFFVKYEAIPDTNTDNQEWEIAKENA